MGLTHEAERGVFMSLILYSIGKTFIWLSENRCLVWLLIENQPFYKTIKELFDLDIINNKSCEIYGVMFKKVFYSTAFTIIYKHHSMMMLLTIERTYKRDRFAINETKTIEIGHLIWNYCFILNVTNGMCVLQIKENQPFETNFDCKEIHVLW